MAAKQHAKNGEKRVLEERVTGVVKWYNVRTGYGFVKRDDNGEELFIHKTAIVKKNRNHFVQSVGDDERLLFDVVQGQEGPEAANVTGPNGEAVKGSRHAPRRPRHWGRGRRRGGRGGAAPSGSGDAAPSGGGEAAPSDRGRTAPRGRGGRGRGRGMYRGNFRDGFRGGFGGNFPPNFPRGHGMYRGGPPRGAHNMLQYGGYGQMMVGGEMVDPKRLN